MSNNESKAKPDAPDAGEPEQATARSDDEVFVEEDRTQPAAGLGAETPSEEEAESEPVEDELAKAREDAKATRERMLRVAADFENYRKRTTRELEDVKRRATLEAIKQLLPVFDNLERATAIGPETDAKSMAEGIQMVHRQFIDTLGKLGIERVAAAGETFDPTIHESIQHEHSDEHDSGMIISELQPGYRMGAVLLRPALVVVSRGPAPQESEAEASAGAAAEGAPEEAAEGGPEEAAERAPEEAADEAGSDDTGG